LEEMIEKNSGRPYTADTNDDRMNPSDLKKLNPLQAQLQYVFQDLDLLIQALTHRSYAHEHGDPGTDHNERLEFLGDTVLGVVLSHLLYRKFPNLSEGELSKLRAGLVNEQQLKQLAQGLKLGKYLRLGRGEEVTGGRKKSSLLADALEAVLGAIYLEGGYDQASRLIRDLYRPQLEAGETVSGPVLDSKTDLQEYCQGRLKTTPTYEVIREEGPAHQKVFYVKVRIGNQVIGQGKGHSKKTAEQQAAERAMVKIRKKTPPGLG
jgi:ribonuclease-3